MATADVAKDAVLAKRLEEAQERIRLAQRSLEGLSNELLDRGLFREPVDPSYVAEVVNLFVPKSGVPMRPLLDKALGKVLPSIGADALAALVTGVTLARLPHEPAWRAMGDATIRLCKAGAFSGAELAEVAWGFATAGEVRADLFAALREAMASHVASLDEAQRRTFAWACAEVGEHATELFGQPPLNADLTASRTVWAALRGLTEKGGKVEALLRDPLPVVAVHDVLSEADGQELIRLADRADLWRSSSRRGARDASGVDALRTSYSAVLSAAEYREHPVVDALRTWAAATLGVPKGYVEALQLVRYNKGEQYGPHVDWGRQQDASIWLGGQRTATALIYLNTLPEGCGGETSFGKLGLRVSPRAGVALLWPNVDADGAPEPLVEHQAMPILCDATKYAVNVWVRGQELPGYGAA